ncbi:hypothetical protein FRB94_004183 [Tulasnella sp. JGI-2019a]|nr:hypothetical protein FRB93_005896 [Tulasnella sp. JGI-2019a]KAG9001978.1 hypothetical protein FRB94_004183 [Tulasnella sp. JGI-2019a]KAG9030270.1 hypothetical protein FRB95_004156 [Tulasnella sp. JGI-2019a]
MRLESDEQNGGPPAFKTLMYLNLGVSHIGFTSAAMNYINGCILSTLPELADGSVDPNGSPWRPRHWEARSTLVSSSTCTTNSPFNQLRLVGSILAGACALVRDGCNVETTAGDGEDARKMIPALMEQMVKADMTRREIVSLIGGFMKAAWRNYGMALLKIRVAIRPAPSSLYSLRQDLAVVISSDPGMRKLS